MPDPRIFPIERTNTATAGVTDASAIVVVANEQRADIEIVNDSDYNVWLARGNAAVVGSGVFLVHNGGSYTMDTQNLFLGYFAAICNLGEDASITISEGEWQ